MSKNFVVLDEIDFKKAIDEINIRIQAIDAKFASNCTTHSAANCTMVSAANCTTVSAHHGPLIPRQTVPPVDNF
jgi:hypothetical protein